MEKIKEAIAANPHYGCLMVAGLMGFYLLGLILNWDWTLESGGGLFNMEFWIDSFGRNMVRIFLGSFMVFGIACCLVLFWYFNSKA